MSNYLAAVKRLKYLRQSNERLSQEVLSLGHFLLDRDRYVSSLGDEVWETYEQVFIAALDCGETDFAKAILLKLGGKFPESQRFRRLVGMSLEANGDFERALEIYDKILEEDESHLPTLKRKNRYP
ncbi:ER membrane complex subunit 2 [Entomophthora muscae]|uniref:ER membrane complex subunit 2 n=1 Tax=Entomophthora muscae TaxID=34485 RepID=A0ACC2UJB3_9FUNG|nr:ER membrane complex subunit 2 [Entomophthora muscae]